jgi:hypothetical protein
MALHVRLSKYYPYPDDIIIFCRMICCVWLSIKAGLMRINFWWRSIAVAFVGCWATAPELRAASIVQTIITDPQSVPFVDNLMFNGFDPSSGTLTAVIITGFSTTEAEVDVLNSKANGAALSFTNAAATTPITITDPSGAQISATASVVQASGSVPANTTMAYLGLTSTEAFTPLNVAPASFSYYYGSPNVNIEYDTSGSQFSGIGSRNLFFGGDATAFSTVELEYDYIPMPLPPLLLSLLTLTALGGGAFVHRRWSASRRMMASI